MGSSYGDDASIDGSVTINDSSADKDFRVESGGNANMLFVDVVVFYKKFDTS